MRSDEYTIGSVTPAAICRVALLFVTILCAAGCAQRPLATQSVSPQASAPANPLSNFGDLLNASRPSSTDAKQGSNSGTGNSDGNKLANTQAVIYDGGGVSRQAVAVGESGPMSASQPAIIPAAYSVAQNGVAAADGDKFQVNFDNADINAVARAILGDVLKSTYTIDPRVHGAISLSAQRPVSRAQLLLLLENALRAQGAVIVQQEGVFRILPSAEAHAVGSANIGPDVGTPGFGITALPLQNISADALTKILDGFGAASGSVRVDAARNVLFVRGSTSERQWLIDTALAFDVDWMRNQAVGIFPIKNNSPEVIISELDQVADPSIVKFQAISRLNAILAVAKSPETVRQVQTWIARFDRSNDYGPRVHVYRLKNADARKVVAVLKEVFGTGSSTAGSESGAPGGPAPIARGPGGQAPATPPETNKPDFNATSSRAGEFGQFGLGLAGSAAVAKIRITADVASNAVVVWGSQEDCRPIERAIIELDRPSPEVAIEAIAAEVTLNDNLTYGVQFYLQGAAKAGNVGSIAQISAAGLPLAQTIPGFNAVLGGLGNPTAVINALRDVTNVKILSSPSLVVADNQAAVLQVGDQVPVTTGTASSTITTQSAIVNSVSYVDTGVILRVTPHISPTFTVRLEIEQEVSAVEQNANAATLTPTISQQKVKSTVVVDSGQTLMLAGMITQQRNMEKSGIPGVVDIPLIGNLMSNSTNSGSRTELIVFVKPQVIRNSVDAQRVAQDLRRRMPGFKDW